MPNRLWVSDFTYVSSWQGMVYVAFVIDVFDRKIVGWRVATSMTTGFVLDALNQAICQRCPPEADTLIHHSDRGSQYLAIKYTERLADAGIDPSVGRVGNSYHNARAESTIGVFKTEIINFLGPWKSVGQVEWETPNWMNWYNTERLHSAIDYVTPLKAEEAFHATMNDLDKVARHLNRTLPGKPGAVQFIPPLLYPSNLPRRCWRSALFFTKKFFDVSCRLCKLFAYLAGRAPNCTPG